MDDKKMHNSSGHADAIGLVYMPLDVLVDVIFRMADTHAGSVAGLELIRKAAFKLILGRMLLDGHTP